MTHISLAEMGRLLAADAALADESEYCDITEHHIFWRNGQIIADYSINSVNKRLFVRYARGGRDYQWTENPVFKA